LSFRLKGEIPASARTLIFITVFLFCKKKVALKMN